MPEEMDDNGQKKTKPPPPQRVAGSYPSFRRSAGLVWVNSATMVLPYRRPCRMIAESGRPAPDQAHPVDMAGNANLP